MSTLPMAATTSATICPSIILGTAPRLRKEGGLILLTVVDNGVGMTEKQLDDLFKPFYTSKPHGTGLGLVIVKKMLAKMNCDIVVTSVLHEGTMVVISIPEGSDGKQQQKYRRYAEHYPCIVGLLQLLQHGKVGVLNVLCLLHPF
jgi:phosphoglycerate-specific signal transduction histidine kinase